MWVCLRAEMSSSFFLNFEHTWSGNLNAAKDVSDQRLKLNLHVLNVHCIDEAKTILERE